MKKIIQILVPLVLLLFLFSSVLAIERVPKKGDTTSGEKKEELKKPSSVKSEEVKIPPEKLSKKERAKKKIEVKKPEKEKEKGIFKIFEKLKPVKKKKIKARNYDYFIDKNGDGIDDRQEKKKIEKKTKKKSEEKNKVKSVKKKVISKEKAKRGK